jgi:hypothetical protein
VFRPHAEVAVNLPNLVAARRIIDEKGLLSSKPFEEWLRQKANAV